LEHLLHVAAHNAQAFDFHDALFLRMSFEFVKLSRQSRSPELLDKMDDAIPEFDEYSQIFNRLVAEGEPAKLAEWIKFSLQLNVKE